MCWLLQFHLKAGMTGGAADKRCTVCCSRSQSLQLLKEMFYRQTGVAVPDGGLR